MWQITKWFCAADFVKKSYQMPLLRRKRFSLEPAPTNLRADEEVFYVEATGEVFRDYTYVHVEPAV